MAIVVVLRCRIEDNVGTRRVGGRSHLRPMNTAIVVARNWTVCLDSL